jgi:hypothetical protein
MEVVIVKLEKLSSGKGTFLDPSYIYITSGFEKCNETKHKFEAASLQMR